MWLTSTKKKNVVKKKIIPLNKLIWSSNKNFKLILAQLGFSIIQNFFNFKLDFGWKIEIFLTGQWVMWNSLSQFYRLNEIIYRTFMSYWKLLRKQNTNKNSILTKCSDISEGYPAAQITKRAKSEFPLISINKYDKSWLIEIYKINRGSVWRILWPYLS